MTGNGATHGSHSNVRRWDTPTDPGVQTGHGGGGVTLATSVCGLRHDPMEQGPTEPDTGRGTFLLNSGGAAGRVLLSGLWYGADGD